VASFLSAEFALESLDIPFQQLKDPVVSDINTPFMAMGLKSSSAPSLAAELGARISIEIPAMQLFETPNILTLASYIGSVCSLSQGEIQHLLMDVLQLHVGLISNPLKYV